MEHYILIGRVILCILVLIDHVGIYRFKVAEGFAAFKVAFLIMIEITC